MFVGATVAVGLVVGFVVGLAVGLVVAVGLAVGAVVVVGFVVGLPVGFTVGLAVGLVVGLVVGLPVGFVVGTVVGFVVGLDSGTVVFYKTSAESKYLSYDELCKIKPHNARVMGLAFDPKPGYIYSCGSDRKFMLSEINYLSNMTEIAQSNAGYTNLEFDKKNERIFLTNEAGIVSVFLTNTFPPSLVNVIQTHSIHCIRGLDIDYTKQYIFTGTNKGDISILDLGLPGKEKLIKEEK